MNCALRFELDDYGKIGITLKTFDSLKEMDLYLRHFQDSNEVKLMFIKEINEFLKTDQAKTFLKTATERKNNGYLRGYVSDMKRAYHVPLIYQSTLIPEKEIYPRLRQSLLKRSVLYDIYYRKPYVLPPNPTRFLRDELAHTVIHNGTSRIFIKEFILYIQKLKPEERYFVLRCLCDKCQLLDNERKKTINKFIVGQDENDEYTLICDANYYLENKKEETNKEIIRNDASSNFKEFNYNDIVHMLEEFDIDEIDRNTTYYDDIEKNRKRGR